MGGAIGPPQASVPRDLHHVQLHLLLSHDISAAPRISGGDVRIPTPQWLIPALGLSVTGEPLV